MKMENKIVMITGAAAGIGKSAAEVFAREGAKVILSDINEKALKEVVAELQAKGYEATGIRHDVASETDWQMAHDLIRQKYGKLDVLLSNAGIAVVSPLVETSLETWNKVISINLTSGFLAAKIMYPLLKESGSGSILYTVSDASEMGFTSWSAYGASKYGLKGLTRYVAAEFAKDNIRVNSIHPSNTDTPLLRAAAGANSAEDLKAYNNPLGRIMTPEEVAQAMLFLSCDDARNINSAALVMDGGSSTFVIM